MFCTKCGQQIPDDSKVCEFCGERFDNAAPAAAPKANPVDAVKAKAASMDKKTLITVLCAAAAVVVVIVLLIVALSGGPKKTVKAYLKATEALSEEELKIDNKYLVSGEKAQKKLGLLDDDDDDDDYDVSWKVSEVKKYGKKDDVTEGIKEYFSQMKADDDKIKASAIVKVTVTIKEDGDKNKRDMFFTCVKIGGNWYMVHSEPQSGKNIKEIANNWEKYAE